MEKNFRAENGFRKNNVNVETVENNVIETAEVSGEVVVDAAKTGMSTKKKVLIVTGVVGGTALITYLGIKVRKWWKNRNKAEQPGAEVKKDEFDDVK